MAGVGPTGTEPPPTTITGQAGGVYIPPSFALDEAGARALIERTGTALLVAADGGGALDAVVVPLLLDGDRLRGHLARANPIWRSPGPVLAAFTPTQGYVSPSWYPSKADDPRVVPTWNYETVIVHGRLSVRDDPAFLRQVVEDLTARHEAEVGSGWQVADAPDDFVDRMLRAIVGIDIAIERIEGKAKLSQNRAVADVDGVIASTPDEGLRAAMRAAARR